VLRALLRAANLPALAQRSAEVPAPAVRGSQ